MRIIGNIVAFLSLYFLPWWLVFVIFLILIAIFNKFYECIIYAFIFDYLYRASTGLDIFSFKITIATIIALVIIEWSKKYLKFYPSR